MIQKNKKKRVKKIQGTNKNSIALKLFRRVQRNSDELNEFTNIEKIQVELK